MSRDRSTLARRQSQLSDRDLRAPPPVTVVTVSFRRASVAAGGPLCLRQGGRRLWPLPRAWCEGWGGGGTGRPHALNRRLWPLLRCERGGLVGAWCECAGVLSSRPVRQASGTGRQHASGEAVAFYRTPTRSRQSLLPAPGRGSVAVNGTATEWLTQILSTRPGRNCRVRAARARTLVTNRKTDGQK